MGMGAAGPLWTSVPQYSWARGAQGARANGALRCVLAGGTWPMRRLHSAGYHPDPTCPRCGEGPETALHRWWQCPALEGLRHRLGVQALAAQARACNFEPRSLWECGLPPLAWLDLPPAVPALTDPPSGQVWDGPGLLALWTDGACSDPTVPVLRRAGWGCFAPGLAEVARTLAGPIHTAQRAEIRAFPGALELTGGFADVATDSALAAQGARRLDAGSALPRRHRDLWARCARLLRPGETFVRKVKAHLAEEAVAAGDIARVDWEGNARADELAALGASQRAIPEASRAGLVRRLATVDQIRFALAQVLLHVVDNPDGVDRPPRLPGWRRRLCRRGARRRGPRAERRDLRPTRDEPLPCGPHLVYRGAKRLGSAGHAPDGRTSAVRRRAWPGWSAAGFGSTPSRASMSWSHWPTARCFAPGAAGPA